MTFRLLRNGSSGFSVFENSKFSPSVFGVHSGMMAPLGKKTYAVRTGASLDAPAASPLFDNMASSRGRLIVAPTPRSMVRRESRSRFLMWAVILVLRLHDVSGTAGW